MGFVALIAFQFLATGRAQTPEDDIILWTAEWNKDGSRFAVAGVNTLWVFDTETLKRNSLLPDTPNADSGNTDATYMAVTSVAWHPSRNLLAVSSQGKNISGVYGIESGERVALTERKDEFGRGVNWHPDGDILAITSDDHLKILKGDGTLLHDIPRYKEAKGLTGVSWRPSGDRIVTVGGRITLHDAQGTPIRQMVHRPEAQDTLQLLLCAEWHPSGEFFAVGDYGTEVHDPVLQFWSADGELLKSITIKGGAEIRNISWNSDGSLLASASDKLRIWTKDGELKHEGDSPDLLWGVAWHPDGDRILTSSMKGRVTLWSPTAKVIRKIIAPPESRSSAERD